MILIIFLVDGGVAYCVYSTSVGRNHYVTVVNADCTVDFSTTFRFTCYVGHLWTFSLVTAIFLICFSVTFITWYLFHFVSFTGQAVTTSGRYVLASDNKGACVQDQTPQKKSATGTGTLTFSSYGIPYIYLEVQKYFRTMHFTSHMRIKERLCMCCFVKLCLILLSVFRRMS